MMVNKRSVLLFMGIALGLASCKNNDNVFPKVESTFLMTVNASADSLNMYLNGTRQNNGSTIFPVGSFGYLAEPSGQQNYQFKKAGQFNYLFSLPLNLKDSVNYSLYIYGTSASQTFTATDVLIPNSTSPDTTQIRFVNASPDAGNLSVTVGDTLSFTNQAFKSVTSFKQTGGGQKEVKIFQVGAATPKVDTLIVFEPGAIYTIFSKGLISGKGSAAFGVGVENHPFSE
jgi:hypothetical protein